MTKLYICEKPSQAKDVARSLGANAKADGCIAGGGMTITWAFGHLLEQAPPDHYDESLKFWDLEKLPVIPDQWHMDVKPDGKKQFGIISRLIKTATEVVIATDADREGEVIARELLDLCGWRGKTSRLWLSALDDASVKKALSNILPGEKTKPLYFAGMCRSRADWLVGMNLTMAYTTAFGTGGGKKGVLSVGRVQTPTLALVVERDKVIEGFVPKDYYEITAVFAARNGDIPCRWQVPAVAADQEGRCVNRQFAEQAYKRVHGKTGRVVKAETRPDREPAPLLFDLSALQQEASRRWGASAKGVLDAAQALYETHKATTYPRTDCQYLPLSQHGDAPGVLAAVSAAKPELSGLVGKSSASLKSRAWNDKKITAHHAIIPTANNAVDVSRMSDLEQKIYDLVCRRYVAQFLGDHEYLASEIEVACESEVFRATGRVTTKPGWKLSEPVAPAPKQTGKKKAAEVNDEAVEEVSLPQVSPNEAVKNIDVQVHDKKTTPPPRFTEGTLIQAMKSIGKMVTDPKLKAVLKETAGIGTEATRAGIIETLYLREYISKEGKKNLVSTEKGRALIAMLPAALTDPATTARWEQALEGVAEGRVRMEDFMGLQEELVRELVGKVKLEAKARPRPNRAAPNAAGSPLYPCPSCQKPMRRIQGPKGEFWGCTGYPECNSTLPDDGGKPGKSSRHEAQVAGGRKGVPSGDIGDICPDCGKGSLVQRFAKDKGKHFIGCSNFPDCRFFKWATT